MEERILNKLEKIDECLDKICTTQAVHTEQLKEHMRRSDLLEKRVEQVDAEMAPIQAHVHKVEGAFKFIALIGTAIAIILGLKELF